MDFLRMLSSTGTPLTEGSLLTSSALVTVALLALVALLYFLDQRCIATGRPISTLGPFLCTANVVQRSLADWKANVISTFPNQKRFSVRSQNKLGQSVSSVYSLPDAPSPLSLPIIGHIYLLAKYPTNPWEGFNAIRSAYGNVVRLQLGNFRSVLVSSTEAIREVLLVKGDIFSDRPHFDRHALIFGNNRQNALALCDWSDIHKSRRSIAHAAVIPRFGTKTFQRLSDCVEGSIEKMLSEVNESFAKNGVGAILEKERLVRLCAAIFVEFLLEKEVNVNDATFVDICHRYDFIFYDINQMYLCDFLPFLKSITAWQYLKYVGANGNFLRDYINGQVIERFEQLIEQRKVERQELAKQKASPELVTKYDEKSCEERFVDRILLHKQYQSSAQFLDFILDHYLDNQQSMTWEECLYEIGDLVGGNSAVANLMVRLLGHLALNPEVQNQLYEEAISVLNSNSNCFPTEIKQVPIGLADQPHMPLTNASIMETLRLASSPIVPHLSRQDTSIGGYFIPKNTMVLFNIYHLNLSSDHWEEPTKFNPGRFVTPEGNVVKPDFFFPFSHGRRSCLGYKMVNTIIFSTVANLLVHYRIEAGSESNRSTMSDLLQPKGTIALPFDGSCFNFHLVARRK